MIINNKSLINTINKLNLTDDEREKFNKIGEDDNGNFLYNGKLVMGGATTEQANQIEANKTNIATLKELVGDSSSGLVKAVTDNASQLDTINKQTNIIYVDKFINKSEDIGTTINNLINNCIDKQTLLLTKEKYTYNNKIIINKSINFICSGELEYTGTDYAIEMACRETNVYVNEINSTGGGIYFTNRNGMNIFNKVYGNMIRAKTNGLNFQTSGNQTGIQYTTCDFSVISAKGIDVNFNCTNNCWIGEIMLYNAMLSGYGTGIQAIGNGTNITGLRILNVGLEQLTTGMIIDGVQFSDFKYRREEELTGKELILRGINQNLQFTPDMFFISNIDISNNRGKNTKINSRIANTPRNYEYLSNYGEIEDSLIYYTPSVDKVADMTSSYYDDITEWTFTINSSNQYTLRTHIITKANITIIFGDEYKKLKNGVNIYITEGITIKDTEGNTMLYSSQYNYNNKVVNLKYIGDKLTTEQWQITQQFTGSRTIGLQGKYLFFGDYITHGQYDDPTYGFPYIIKETNPNMTISNRSEKDYTLSRNDDSKSILNLIDAEIAKEVVYDYIFLQGGFNDIAKNIPLGVYDTTSTTNEVDENTIYGAVESAIRKIQNKWPSAIKICFIIPHDVKVSIVNVMYDNIKTICAKYRLDVLDLRHNGLDVENLSIRSICFGSDFESDGGKYYINRDGYINYYNKNVIDYIKR